jgi:hypothetical protein
VVGFRRLCDPNLVRYSISLGTFSCRANRSLFLLKSKERMFIHSAQGHGRTGMLAVALLLEKGSSDSVEQALNMLQARRPKLRVNSAQRQFLEQCSDRKPDS